MGALFPTIVYCLCFLTSAACAALLGRMFVKSGARMLFWSAACFFLLAITNFIVVLDLLVFPEIDFRTARLWLSLAAVSLLLFGFTWDNED
jgi:hypothetical protein